MHTTGLAAKHDFPIGTFSIKPNFVVLNNGPYTIAITKVYGATDGKLRLERLHGILSVVDVDQSWLAAVGHALCYGVCGALGHPEALFGT